MNSSNKPWIPREATQNRPVPETDKNRQAPPQGHREVGGPPGLEPTRYGDWEKGGRCIDF
jgi:hypothetical protein